MAAATSDHFQSQLDSHLQSAARLSVTHVERHNVLAPLKSARRPKDTDSSRSTTDILEILTNANKRRRKLTSVESERLMIIYDEAVRHSKLALVLPGICSQDGDFYTRFAVQFGGEVSSAIAEHRHIMGVALDNEGDERVRQLLVERLQISVRTLLRAMSRSPHISQLILSVDFPVIPSDEGQALLHIMQAYRCDLKEQFAESHQDQVLRTHHNNRLEQIQSRRGNEIDELREELKKRKVVLGSKVAEKGLLLTKLMNQLSDLQDSSKNFAKATSEEVKVRIEEQDKSKSIAELREAATQAKGQLAAETEKQKKEQLEQRKRNFRVESEVDQWIQKYDADMGEKQAQFDELEAAHNAERAQLDELSVRFQKVFEQRNTILEERRLAAEKRAQDELDLQRQVTSAVFIQYMWRKMLQRRLLNKKQKKKKKGKGSGKKRKGSSGSRKGSSRKGSARKGSGKTK